MTRSDRMQLLKSAVDEHGQANVARMIGYSASTLSQILSGKYLGDPATVLLRVDEVFGSTTVQCPIRGEISMGECADTRRQPFAATNAQRVRQYKACRDCERRQP